MTLLAAREELSPIIRTTDPSCDPSMLPEFYIDWIFGNCCEPLVFHGEGVLVSKAAPVETGDLVAIMARTPGERAGLTNGFVKRFIGWHRDANGQLILATELLNPRRLRLFPSAQVLAVHKVVSVLSMDGGAKPSVERLERIASIASTFGRRPLGTSIGAAGPPGV